MNEVHRQAYGQRFAAQAGWICGLLAFFVWLWLSHSAGVTWDEPVYSAAAENAGRWLQLVAQGRFAEAADPVVFGGGWGLANEVTPLVRILNGVGWLVTQDLLLPPVHHRVGTIALGAAALGAMVCLTARLRNLREALFFAAALLTMPRLFFHAQLGATDFPLAATWGLATVLFFQQLSIGQDFARMHFGKRVRVALHRGFVIGAWAAIAVLAKINAVLLGPFWLGWVLLYRRQWASVAKLAAAVMVAPLVLYAGWPWIWKDPLPVLQRFLVEYTAHPDIRQWFAGQLYVETGWAIPLTIFLITVPVPLLLLGFWAVVASVGKRWRLPVQNRLEARGRPAHVQFSGWVGLHGLGMITVLIYFGLPFNNLHDQDRMLSPAYVHLAFLAGVGFDRLWRWIGTQRSITRLGAARSLALQVGLAALLVAPGAWTIARLHPYELAYYNGLARGLPGAQHAGMETIYFAATYAHFLPVLNTLPQESEIWVMPNSWDVLYYYRQNGLLREDLIPLRPHGWSSFYDGQGVPYALGGLERADFAIIERRQTTFNDTIPEYAIQLTWVETMPEVARLERDGVVLATLHARQ